MECQEIKHLIPAYLNRELAEKELELIRSHLAGCEHCRRDCRAFEKSWAALEQWEDLEPEPGYVSRFWTRLAEKRPWYERFGLLLKEALLTKRLLPVYAASLVVVIVGFFVLRTSLTIHHDAVNFATLPAEDIEFIESMDMAVNLDVLNDLDFLEDMDVIEQVESAGKKA